jgi:hypothetical protein
MGVSGLRHAPAALYPGKRTHGIHWTGGWVGPRAGLDAETRRKILCRGSNPGRPVRSQTLYCLSSHISMYRQRWKRSETQQLVLTAAASYGIVGRSSTPAAVWLGVRIPTELIVIL